jgi:hypothetical protein
MEGITGGTEIDSGTSGGGLPVRRPRETDVNVPAIVSGDAVAAKDSRDGRTVATA